MVVKGAIRGLKADLIYSLSTENHTTDLPPKRDLAKPDHASENLKVAIELGDLELCQRLVESDAKLNCGFGGCSGCTPLLYSLQRDQLSIPRYLISQGALLEGETCKDFKTRGYTVFHYAVAHRSSTILRLLLEKSSRGCLDTYHPVHPIHIAAACGSSECIEEIISHVTRGKRFLSRTLMP